MVDQLAMAVNASILNDAAVAFLDLNRVLEIAGGERQRVKKPLSALVRYLPSRLSCGVWQSLHTATAWWLDFCHESYASCITWQLAQVAGLLPRYA
jgi:hypothetical protein